MLWYSAFTHGNNWKTFVFTFLTKLENKILCFSFLRLTVQRAHPLGIALYPVFQILTISWAYCTPAKWTACNLIKLSWKSRQRIIISFYLSALNVLEKNPLWIKWLSLHLCQTRSKLNSTIQLGDFCITVTAALVYVIPHNINYDCSHIGNRLSYCCCIRG